MNFDEEIKKITETFSKDLDEKIKALAKPFTLPSVPLVPEYTTKKNELDDFLEMSKWLKVVKHPSVIVIIGNRGSGKSALGYKILEYKRWEGKIYVVGLSEKAGKILPSWIGHVPLLEDVPADSIALVDEAYISMHSRSSSSQHSMEISNIINLSRQCEQTLIFVSQEARQIDKNIASSANVVIIKNPGILQLNFDRIELRKMLAEATKMFAAIDKDKNKWAYVYAPESDFAGMMQNSLPTFWTSGLSKAYADAKPSTEVKTPRNATGEERIEKAKELRKQGFSLGEIAHMLGVSKSTVMNYLDGYPYMKKGK
jgi:hypothetical protein